MNIKSDYPLTHLEAISLSLQLQYKRLIVGGVAGDGDESYSAADDGEGPAAGRDGEQYTGATAHVTTVSHSDCRAGRRTDSVGGTGMFGT